MVDVLSGGRGPGDELALQYSRARYFDLKHGRFLQRDPKGYIDGSNLYEAFGSNPARFTDPYGLFGLERGHQRVFPRTGDNCYQPWDYIPNVADIEAPNRFGLWGPDGDGLGSLEFSWQCRSIIFNKIVMSSYGLVLDTSKYDTSQKCAQKVVEEVWYTAQAIPRMGEEPVKAIVLYLISRDDPSLRETELYQSALDVSIRSYGQGAINVPQGLQNVIIGTLNTPIDLYMLDPRNRAAFVGLGLDPDWRIPSPQWADGAIIRTENWAYRWSTTLGGEAAVTLLTVGTDKYIRWAKAAKEASLLDDSARIRFGSAAPSESLRPIETYRRGGFRRGVREQVWENATSPDGFVRDPKTGRVMRYDEPWDVGHAPGYEFAKHQRSAQRRGLTREQFLDEYNHPDVYQHYRPELPSSNRSRALEAADDVYFGP